MDDIPDGLLFAALALLICLSAFFSSSETATMALNRYRLADRANKKDRRAILLQKLIREPDRLLSTILLGNNLVNNAAVAITTMLAWKYYGEAGVAISTAGITIIILVMAEIPPKTIAAIFPERIAFLAAYPLDFLKRLFHPVVWILSSVVKLLKLIPGFNVPQESDSLDADELRVAVKASQRHFAPDQMEFFLGILDLGAQSVDSVMIPRSDIHAIDLEEEITDVVEQILSETRKRVLIFEKSFDEIKGELDIRELLQSYDRNQITKEIIQGSLREPIYVPANSGLLEQYQRLQQESRDVGIVVDEYGEIIGLVTMNAMMKEIAGVVGWQLREANFGIVLEDTGSYLVSAMINVRELNRKMNWDLPTDGPNTLNGQILKHYEDIPQPGTMFKLNGYPVETVRMQGSAVEVARVFPKLQDSEVEERQSAAGSEY